MSTKKTSTATTATSAKILLAALFLFCQNPVAQARYDAAFVGANAPCRKHFRANPSAFSSASSYTRRQHTTASTSTSLSPSALCMSLKPAAMPLMDSGKALARAGELLIDLTTALDLYGGGLSAAGAQMRNAGDCVAQAAASCRFKTGAELVTDELRESGTCLAEAVSKLEIAVQEAAEDQQAEMGQVVARLVEPTRTCGQALEAAGAGIMQRLSMDQVGAKICEAGECLQSMAVIVPQIDPEQADGQVAGQRIAYAAEKMVEAGNALQGIKPKPSGKSWLKGGQ